MRPQNKNLLSGGVRGHKGAGGRPTDEFKKKMLALSNSPAAWKFRQDVIEGKPIEERMILNLVTGKEVKTLVTPSIENRRRMLADIDDRAHGKPAQAVEMSGSIDTGAQEAMKQIAAGVSEFLSSVKQGAS